MPLTCVCIKCTHVPLSKMPSSIQWYLQTYLVFNFPPNENHITWYSNCVARVKKKDGREKRRHIPNAKTSAKTIEYIYTQASDNRTIWLGHNNSTMNALWNYPIFTHFILNFDEGTENMDLTTKKGQLSNSVISKPIFPLRICMRAWFFFSVAFLFAFARSVCFFCLCAGCFCQRNPNSISTFSHNYANFNLALL